MAHLWQKNKKHGHKNSTLGPEMHDTHETQGLVTEYPIHFRSTDYDKIKDGPQIYLRQIHDESPQGTHRDQTTHPVCNGCYQSIVDPDLL
jgi:hypothetical protein